MGKQSTVTGERLTIGKSSVRNQQDHVARYEFAQKYVDGKKVLDIACGTGYGTSLLKRAGAAEVFGVDIDSGAVQYANNNFKEPGVTFLCESATHKIFEDSTFDVIVSYETIEHLTDDDRSKYLHLIRSALKEDGVALFSTPNKLITSPWSVSPLNPYHILEYYRDGFQKELENQKLTIIDWYGQRYVHVFFTKRLVYLLVRLCEKILRKEFGIYSVADSAEVRPQMVNKEPRYFVVTVKK